MIRPPAYGRCGAALGVLALLVFLFAPACGGGGGAAPDDGGTVTPTPPAPDPDPVPPPPVGPPPFENKDAVLFTEVSESAGVVATFLPPDRVWINAQWRAGGAVGDFNGDGHLDLFVLCGGNGPDQLHLGNGDGTFTEVGAAWGVAVAHFGSAVAVGDYDGDGWLDMYVTSEGLVDDVPAMGHHRLYRNTGQGGHNTGQGGFEEVAALAGVTTTSTTLPDGTSAAFGDYDLDGDLDLFVCGWADPVAGNRLFRNEGDGTFTDVTSAALPPRVIYGLTPRFVDMDGDRYPELIVAGDYRTSAYFVNRGDGTFEDRTTASGTNQDTNGMGSAVGDLDGDGRLDWYVTSIYVPEPPPPQIPTGNMLYLNRGGHVFEEVAYAAGVADGNWGWGAETLDVDNDGLLDIAETNGWSPKSPTSPNNHIDGRLFLNGGDGTFMDIAKTCGYTKTNQGRGLIVCDFDADGDQDIVTFNYGEPLRIYRNDTATGNHWLRFVFDTSADDGLAPNGIGTRVRLRIGDVTRIGYLDGGSSYCSHSECAIHFGLRDVTLVDEVRVEWADGRVTTLTDVPVDQTLEVVSPGL